MEPHEEIFSIAKRLAEVARSADDPAFSEPIERLQRSIETVARAWSGSSIGYHANVYYANLQPPPAGAHFSSEWGMMDTLSDSGTQGDWHEFVPEKVRKFIHSQAGNPDLVALRAIADRAVSIFETAKSDALSVLHQELSGAGDTFLDRIKNDLEEIKFLNRDYMAEYMKPKGQFITRDMMALGQGRKTAPHIFELAETTSLRQAIDICRQASDLLTKAGSHMERKLRRSAKLKRIGTNVFIGHGRSSAWRELKDFIQDRVGLPWDEFNRVPVAGVTNIARLSEMLDAAAIALLIMTGEDETVDGSVQARMNVIHEAGLFQGRLGFSRAIVMLEEGCAEFSNIQGLGQIRFPKGRISAVFEEVRQVLEREGLIEAP